MEEAIKKTLSSLTVKHVLNFKAKNTPQGRAVVKLEHNQTVASALKMLAAHKILSAPLVIPPGLEDMEGGSMEVEEQCADTLIGWVDIADILKSLLQHLHTKFPNNLPSAMLQLMSALEAETASFGKRTLVSLSGGDDKTLVYTGESDASLLRTINEFYLNNAGMPGRVVHRLAMFDAHGQVEEVLSQLDIIKYLAAHEEALGDAGKRTLAQLGLLPAGPGHVVVVDPRTPTLLALEKLVAAGVSAGAVVADDGTGALIANLSISDLRCIQPEHLGVLALPVGEFLAVLHQTSYLGFSCGKGAQHPFFANGPRTPPRPPSASGSAEFTGPASPGSQGAMIGKEEEDQVKSICCSRDTTLHAVLHLLADHHVHRVYVIDPVARPQVVAVITPTDILRWLLKEASA